MLNIWSVLYWVWPPVHLAQDFLHWLTAGLKGFNESRDLCLSPQEIWVGLFFPHVTLQNVAPINGSWVCACICLYLHTERKERTNSYLCMAEFTKINWQVSATVFQVTHIFRISASQDHWLKFQGIPCLPGFHGRETNLIQIVLEKENCLLYTSPSPRD